MRTAWVWVAAAVLMAPAATAAAQDGRAQAYPVRPVRMVIHIGPGSSMDIVGRVLGQKLGDGWGQTVVVDNRAGAGGAPRTR